MPLDFTVSSLAPNMASPTSVVHLLSGNFCAKELPAIKPDTKVSNKTFFILIYLEFKAEYSAVWVVMIYRAEGISGKPLSRF